MPHTVISRLDLLTDEYLRERTRWLVWLRWLAIAGAALTCGAAAGLGVIQTGPQMAVIVAAMAVHNLVLMWAGRWWARSTAAVLHRVVFIQLLLDAVALSALLHFSDSVENPFAMFMVFPVAVGATLLPPRVGLALTALCSASYSAVVLGEYTGVLDHYSFFGDTARRAEEAMFEHQGMVIGYIAAVSVTLFGVGYFVDAVSRRHRQALLLSQQREQVALSRERMARVGQIAAGVAHSVRNPLHGLVNGLDLLAARLRSDADAEATVALMDEGLRRIDTVTQRLLVLTRDVPIAPRPTDIDALVRDTHAFLVVPRTGQTPVPTDLQLGGVGMAEVDPDRVSEALANILSNSLDACAAGGNVTVVTESGDGTVSIEVRDTGTGIAEDQLPLVFDPFYTTKPVGSGTGLGLAIARRVVEEHGGEIMLDSRSGDGTVVRMLLPRRAATSEPETTP